jgi:hypothetical protein
MSLLLGSRDWASVQKGVRPSGGGQRGTPKCRGQQLPVCQYVQTGAL